MARDAVNEIRERTDIVELVGNYVQLKRTGRSYKGLCPFHQEKTPSFIVFPDSQNFHCFGCGKGGDAFTFYMGVEHVEFREALTELAKQAGVTLDTMPVSSPEVDAHRQRLIDLNEQAATFFANVLANSERGAAGRQLAEQRGLTTEIVQRFQLGFAPDGWDYLLRYFSSRDVDPALAAEAGLLQTRDSGGFYDRFRNRFMFPIRNRDGAVVGFGGRALGDAMPKYLNSPQTAIFDKSSLLYGLDLAAEEIRRRDQVVIVEGYMDAIAAHQFGHPNVVAAMGTALTEAQVAQVKRLSKHIVLALDADTAGQMATLRGLETMQGALDHDEVPVADPTGLIHFERKLKAEIAIVELPEGKDPDELLRRSPERWPEIVASARPFLDFFIDTVTAPVDLNDARAKAEAVKRVSPILRQIGDRVVQAHYVGRLASRLQLDDRVVQSEVRRSALRTSASPTSPAAPRQSAAPHAVRTEDHLLAILLQHRALTRGVIDAVPEEELMDSRNRALLQILRDDTIPDLPPEQLLAGLDDHLAEHGEHLMTLIAGKPAQLPGQIEREAQRALTRHSKERYDFLMRRLQEDLKASQSDPDADPSTIESLTAQIGSLAARHHTYDPPPSPYFLDSRSTNLVRASRPSR